MNRRDIEHLGPSFWRGRTDSHLVAPARSNKVRPLQPPLQDEPIVVMLLAGFPHSNVGNGNEKQGVLGRRCVGIEDLEVASIPCDSARDRPISESHDVQDPVTWPIALSVVMFWTARTMGKTSAGLYVSLRGKTMSTSICCGVVMACCARTSVASAASAQR